jgi:ATPase subunit of ABC transporter with duplicated ATPase domains
VHSREEPAPLPSPRGALPTRCRRAADALLRSQILIVVSHDRDFLTTITTVAWPLAAVLATCNTQHATGNTQHATCNTQHATCNTQHATRSMQQATRSMQHATRSMQHASRSMQLTAHSMQHAQHETGGMKQVACNPPHATFNTQQSMKHGMARENA